MLCFIPGNNNWEKESGTSESIFSYAARRSPLIFSQLQWYIIADWINLKKVAQQLTSLERCISPNAWELPRRCYLQAFLQIKAYQGSHWWRFDLRLCITQQLSLVPTLTNEGVLQCHQASSCQETTEWNDWGSMFLLRKRRVWLHICGTCGQVIPDIGKLSESSKKWWTSWYKTQRLFPHFYGPSTFGHLPFSLVLNGT